LLQSRKKRGAEAQDPHGEERQRRVANHEARGRSFETRWRAPQDEA